MSKMGNIELFILDLDGTIYFENQLIDGALDFIKTLSRKNIKYLFLTNNSSISKSNYVEKLEALGIPCQDEDIYSSGGVTGIFLSKYRKGKNVFLVGTKALSKELTNYGIEITKENPDIVLVGYDRELDYNKLELACFFLEEGAEFIATNPDLLYPIKNKRYLPDCGSICKMLTTATKKEPLFIGKPNRYIIDIIVDELSVSHDRVAMVGDRLYTDIALGKNAGIFTVLVLSGETDEGMVYQSKHKPDLVVSSVKELTNLINK